MRVFNDISIGDRNSFHIDVTAQKLIEYNSIEDLVTIFTDPQIKPESWRVLSGGNNILFTKEVTTTLLTPVSTYINIVSEDADTATISIAAGVEWDDVVEWCVGRDLWGVENLSLIPGKAGAAPIQNIGAYGVEIADVLIEVNYFDTESLSEVKITNERCRFAYRDSIFKRELKGVAIVTSITIKLSKIPTPKLNYADVMARVESRGGATLRNIREVICEIRNEKLPDTKVMGNAGSFFKNPIVESTKVESLLELYPTMPHYPIADDPSMCKLAAGWLIDQSNMKGYRTGNVGVHSNQALVLVNYGGASGDEVIGLAHKVQQEVKERFGVEIECEVNIM